VLILNFWKGYRAVRKFLEGHLKEHLAGGALFRVIGKTSTGGSQTIGKGCYHILK
jgi:hypothetical protein